MTVLSQPAGRSFPRKGNCGFGRKEGPFPGASVYAGEYREVRAGGGLVQDGVIMVDPLGYIDFLSLVKDAALVVTDSGGIQEETTFLGVPCITVRDNTERPVTVEMGANFLVGTDFLKVASVALEVLGGGT